MPLTIYKNKLSVVTSTGWGYQVNNPKEFTPSGVLKNKWASFLEAALERLHQAEFKIYPRLSIEPACAQ